MQLGLLPKTLWMFRKSLIIILTPLLLLPLPILGKSQVSSCGYILCVMAVYWMTEACPLAVTSLLPVFCFPFFGIQSADKVSMNYTNQVMFLFFGAFMLCIAIEEWNLHKRFALRALMFFGSKFHWILLGLMLITAFLSMWLSNTSASGLMLPIALAVYDEMVSFENQNSCPDSEDKEVSDNDEARPLERDEVQNTTSRTPPERNHEPIELKKSLLLGVTYASSIGGIVTIVGTPTNVVGIGILSSTFSEEAVKDLTFFSWIAFCLPVALVCILITWLWLIIRFIGIRKLLTKRSEGTSRSIHQLIRSKYESLAPLSFGEISVLFHFFALIILWLLRDPKFIPGWKSVLPGGYARDSTISIVIGVSLFLFPSRITSFQWMWTSVKTDDLGCPILPQPSPSLLSWEAFQKKFPWNVFLLLGSGFALAGGCMDSGLSEWLGLKLTILQESPTWVVMLVISSMISLITEFTGNAPALSLLLPITIRVGMDFGINPVMILFASTIPASFAFCLPIATPPNALAFTYDSLKIKDMASTGIVLNIACVLVFNLFLHLTGVPIFHLHDIPEWAAGNMTSLVNKST